MLHEDWNKNQIKFLKSYLNEVGKILIQKFSDLSCWPFCCHWAWWRETKLLHFLIWRLFDALTIFEHNLYQFMAITLRYVTILNFIYRILKPIFLWNFYCWSFNFWSIEGAICRFLNLFLFYLVLCRILHKKAKNWKYLSKSCQKKHLENVSNIRHRRGARSYDCKT